MIEKVNSLTQELNKNLTTKINDFISLMIKELDYIDPLKKYLEFEY